MGLKGFIFMNEIVMDIGEILNNYNGINYVIFNLRLCMCI